MYIFDAMGDLFGISVSPHAIDMYFARVLKGSVPSDPDMRQGVAESILTPELALKIAVGGDGKYRFDDAHYCIVRQSTISTIKWNKPKTKLHKLK